MAEPFRTLTPAGTEILVEPIPHVRSCSVGFWVRRGSRHEGPAEEGLAHFLEHTVFKGTESYATPDEMAAATDRLGGHVDAFTGKEVTGYYAKAASSKLDTISDVVFDIFLNSKLEQGAMEIERGPIIEELRMRRDDPQQHIGRLTEELLYGDQPAGWAFRPGVYPLKS